MPVLKHAKKKLRQDIRRTAENRRVKNLFRSLIKKAKENPTAEAISTAFKSVDKAAKQNIIHKNKASRIKSSLAKVAVSGPVKKSTVKKSSKKTVKSSSKSSSRKSSKK